MAQAEERRDGAAKPRLSDEALAALLRRYERSPGICAGILREHAARGGRRSASDPDSVFDFFRELFGPRRGR